MTPNHWILVSAIAALAVLAGLVALRTLTNNRAEVRVTDAIIAILPVAIALFAGGKIEELVIGTEGITVKAAKQAVVEAASARLDKNVSSLSKVDYEAFQVGPKGSMSQLESLRRANIGALSLKLGCRHCYVGSAVRVYLETLSENPKFRYLALIHEDSDLAGVIDARGLRAWLDVGLSFDDENQRDDWLFEVNRVLESPAGLKGIRTAEIEGRVEANTGSTSQSYVNELLRPWQIFVTAVEESNTAFFEGIPGFVPAETAVEVTTTKDETLRRMASLGANWLPVVNRERRLVGAVERAEVTASIVLDLTENFEKLAVSAAE